VNGKPIKGLSELAKSLETIPKDGIHTIETDKEPYQIFLDQSLSDRVDQDFVTRGLPILQRLYKTE
jgi:hypothetical protein